MPNGMTNSTILLLFKRNDFYCVPSINDGVFDIPVLQGSSIDGTQIADTISKELEGCEFKICGICKLRACQLPFSKRYLFAVLVVVELVDTESLNFRQRFGGKWQQWQWKPESELKALHREGKMAFDITAALDSVRKGQLAPAGILLDESVFDYELKDKPLERAVLESAKYDQGVLEKMREVFLRSLWPYQEMNKAAFRQFLCQVLGMSQADATGFADNYFVPMSSAANNADGAAVALRFWDFVTGLAAMEPHTNHGGRSGEFRTRLVFRKYARTQNDYMTKPELRQLLIDGAMVKSKGEPSEDMAARATAKVEDHKGLFNKQGNMPIHNFLNAVGQLQLRGTSVLCRYTPGFMNTVVGYVTDTASAPDEDADAGPSHGHQLRSTKKRKLKDGEDVEDVKPVIRKLVRTAVTQTEENENDVVDIMQVNGNSAQPAQQDRPAFEVSFYAVNTAARGIRDWVEETHELDDDAVTQSAQINIRANAVSPLDRPCPVNAQEMPKGLDYFTRELQPNQSRANLRKRPFNWGSQPVNAQEMLKGLDYFTRELQPNQSRANLRKRPFDWGSQVASDNQATCLIKLATDVEQIFRSEPRYLKIPAPCYVMGDIHGNFQDLTRFHDCFWSLGMNHSPANVLFLGDYVDRGDHGWEVVGYLFAQKVMAPNRVFLLRGNHEIRYLQRNFQFFEQCIARFGPLANDVWEKVNRAFDAMPLAAQVDNDVFCSHGGIPHPSLLQGKPLEEAINAIPVPLALNSPGAQRRNRPMTTQLAWDLLWNDPEWDDQSVPLDPHGFGENPKRQTAHVFSAKALSDFLAKNNYKHCIRAHTVQKMGFQVRYGGHLFTVFSSSNYAGHTNSASCVLIQSDKRLEVLKMKVPILLRNNTRSNRGR